MENCPPNTTNNNSQARKLKWIRSLCTSHVHVQIAPREIYSSWVIRNNIRLTKQIKIKNKLWSSGKDLLALLIIMEFLKINLPGTFVKAYNFLELIASVSYFYLRVLAGTWSVLFLNGWWRFVSSYISSPFTTSFAKSGWRSIFWLCTILTL